MMYHVRLERNVWFWDVKRFSPHTQRTRRPKKKWIRSRISVRLEADDSASLQDELNRMADEFSLGRGWRFMGFVESPQE